MSRILITVLSLLFASLCQGCGTGRPTGADLPGSAGAAADAKAAEVVAEWNAGEGGQAFGTVRMENYSRSTTRVSGGVVGVTYVLDRPLNVIGHPNHFSIYVWPGTGKVEVVRGF